MAAFRKAKSILYAFFFFLHLLLLAPPAIARKKHVIAFRSPDLFPESAAWDPSAQHFVVGSVRRASLHSVSDAGVVEPLVSDPDLPANVSVLGVAVDPAQRRAVAVVIAGRRFRPFDALAAYDLGSGRRIFLTRLDDGQSGRPIANGVALDPAGNAFVTSSMGNFIWKVGVDGTASVFSKSSIFQSAKVSMNNSDGWCGLNGIAYAAGGFFLVVQTNTGKLFKVDATDGTARWVLVSSDLTGAEGIALRRDGAAVVVAPRAAWLLKGKDGWSEAAVLEEVSLDAERFPTGVAVREGNRAYVVYGRANEGMAGIAGRDEFHLEEIQWAEEEAESIWVWVMVGLGLCYFMYWRFLMGQLGEKLNKKRA